MKKGIILRWLGGSGGDTLLYVLYKQNNFYTNVSFSNNNLTSEGKTLIDEPVNKEYPTFEHASNYDVDPFLNDLKNLSKKTKSFIIKQHFTSKDLDRKIGNLVDIVDIGFDYKFLPFIVRANFQKTETVKNRNHPKKTHLNETLKKINRKLNLAQTDALTIWNILIHNKDTMEKFKLLESPLIVNDFFHNPKRIEMFFKTKGLSLNLNIEHFSNWKKRNSDLLPSIKYQNYLKHKNYNYTDKDLNIVEKYVLLSLSGSKFKFLD